MWNIVVIHASHLWQVIMKILFLALGMAVAGGVWFAADSPGEIRADRPARVPAVPAGAQVITLGGGCFWHMQSVLEPIPGVLSVTVGYMGGATKDPNYEHLRGTGYTEVARVVFDPEKTSLEKILRVFWTAHRPTAAQSPTARSVIFYDTDEQRSIAAKSKVDAAKLFSQPLATEIAKAGEFYAAEEYHQDYYKKHGAQSCGL